MKIIKVISLGKAKYRSLTLGPIIDNSKNVSIFTDYPVSLIKCFIFCLINKTIMIKIFFLRWKYFNFKLKNFKIFLKLKILTFYGLMT